MTRSDAAAFHPSSYSVLPSDDDPFGHIVHDIGLTKREAFAMAAMQGLLSKGNILHEATVGRVAVGYADALINALNAGGEE